MFDRPFLSVLFPISCIFAANNQDTMFSQDNLNSFVEKAVMTLGFKDEPQTLYEPIGYMFGIGGKHLRPRLCLTSFNLFSDDITDSILYPAVAIEIFHEFTLVHDDIMDKSDTRRGQKTVVAKWGENTAILSGDAMSILAYRYLAMCPKDKLQDVLKLFTDTALEVCEGQQYDMDYEDLPFITMDEYMAMIGKKTGALIACPAAMGALLAGADGNKVKALYEFGYKTGLAFQITDDYLDCFGDARVFGKPIGGDIANNKKSWMLVEAQQRAKAQGRNAELQNLLKLPDERRAEKIESVTRMLEELGVKESAAEAILKCHNEAVEALESAGFTEEQVERMKSFAESLIHREK